MAPEPARESPGLPFTRAWRRGRAGWPGAVVLAGLVALAALAWLWPAHASHACIMETPREHHYVWLGLEPGEHAETHLVLRQRDLLSIALPRREETGWTVRIESGSEQVVMQLDEARFAEVLASPTLKTTDVVKPAAQAWYHWPGGWPALRFGMLRPGEATIDVVGKGHPGRARWLVRVEPPVERPLPERRPGEPVPAC